jgi:CubicO group peptidase (beta-lactamase class C family)
MARYLVAHLAPGAGGCPPLLSVQGFAELHRQQVRISEHVDYALGWRVTHLDGEQVITHTGETANYHSEMIVLPESGMGLVILTNCNNGAIAQLALDRIGAGMVRLLRGQPRASQRLTFQGFYLLFNGLALLLSVLSGWSLFESVQSWRRSGPALAREGVLLVGQLVLPLALLRYLPRRFHASFRLLRLYVPDMTWWLFGLVALSLAASVVRLACRTFKR